MTQTKRSVLNSFFTFGIFFTFLVSLVFHDTLSI